MVVCPSCGAANVDGSRFCHGCGKALGGSAKRRESRRTVTVLFADVAGSTELGERLDPETVRSLMARYFQVAHTIVERHGGTIEKFIGDAVMAVFGVPLVHEDDALRAVRAAVELRAGLAQLGMGLDLRMGINTGEVIAGDSAAGESFVTGDTVNVAARLESAADAGEILLGPATVALIRDAAVLGPVRAFQLKGKGELVSARAVTGLETREGRRFRPGAPLVGRDRELATLDAAWERVVAGSTPELVTILAPPGVGKSRLAAEFIVRPSNANVLVGRCLSYGEGITYWPIREIVHMAAAIDDADEADAAVAKLHALLEGEPDADMIGRRIATAIGLFGEPAPQEEVFWAFRRLLEALAGRQPLLVVVEDLHWADPTLLDLLEYNIDLAAEVPLLIIATARPGLLDARPGWGGGRPNSVLLRLEPLGTPSARELLDALAGGSAIPDGLKERILDAAEGTPLYVEEFVALLRDEGALMPTDDGWQARADLEALVVPPTVQALLAARLDGLPLDERMVAERASVVGRSFESSALPELDPELSTDLGRRLLALVRKDLLRRERAELTSGDAFRFRHILIRDAAYAALPKAERAILHERVADWLVRVAGDRINEYEEILGYHLEQAYRYHTELVDPDEQIARLGVLSCHHLRSAGHRAVNRGDLRSAEGLFERALAFRGVPASTQAELLVDEADLLERLGRYDDAARVAVQALETADSVGDSRLAARARIVGAICQAEVDPETGVARMLETGREALAVLESAGDHEGIAHALGIIAMAEWGRGRLDACGALYDRVILELEQSPDASRVPRIKAIRALVAAQGRTPATTLLIEIELLLREVQHDRQGTSLALCASAWAYAMTGRQDEARSAMDRAVSLASLLGLDADVASMALDRGFVELFGGFPIEAEQAVRPALDYFRSAGERNHAGGLAALLAEALAEQGRHDEALEASDLAAEIVQRDDPVGQAMWRVARSRALIGLWRADEAVRLATEAVGLLDPTDFLNNHADALLALGTALSAAGDHDAARVAARQGHAELVAKGNIVWARQAERAFGLAGEAGLETRTAQGSPSSSE